VRRTASVTLRSTSGETRSGVFSAREAVMGATSANRATSCSVTAPLLRRVRREGVRSIDGS